MVIFAERNRNNHIKFIMRYTGNIIFSDREMWLVYAPAVILEILNKGLTGHEPNKYCFPCKTCLYASPFKEEKFADNRKVGKDLNQSHFRQYNFAVSDKFICASELPGAVSWAPNIVLLAVSQSCLKRFFDLSLRECEGCQWETQNCYVVSCISL